MNVLIDRGCHTAMREGPNVQLSGAFRVTRHSHMCHQRQLPSGHRTRCSYRVAPRRSPSSQRPRGQWERQGFRGCYTELQSHQGVPHLLCPGLSCSSSRRSGDQSRMWERFRLACLSIHRKKKEAFLCWVELNIKMWKQNFNTKQLTLEVPVTLFCHPRDHTF